MYIPTCSFFASTRSLGSGPGVWGAKRQLEKMLVSPVLMRVCVCDLGLGTKTEM